MNFEGGYDLRFKTSFNCLVAGASGTGKTTFVKNLLSVGDQIFTVKPKKVFLFYSAMQDIYIQMENEGLVHELISVDSKTLPSYDDFYAMAHPYKNSGGSMMIFDDIMSLVNPDFEQLFCNLSHHENCSVIFLTQNLFYKDKAFRTMSLNSHYIVLMKNDRDKMQTSNNICECVYNVIHTDLNLPKQKKNKLKNFIKANCSIHRINKIASKKENLFKRRKALKQEGKGLPMILATAIPFLIDLITGRK